LLLLLLKYVAFVGFLGFSISFDSVCGDFVSGNNVPFFMLSILIRCTVYFTH
jgi:hypothetical protein